MRRESSEAAYENASTADGARGLLEVETENKYCVTDLQQEMHRSYTVFPHHEPGDFEIARASSPPGARRAGQRLT